MGKNHLKIASKISKLESIRYLAVGLVGVLVGEVRVMLLLELLSFCCWSLAWSYNVEVVV